MAGEMSAAQQIAPVKDMRKAPRERVMLSATLSFQRGAVSLSCVATQISATGARISVSAEVVLSQTMRLVVPQREIDAQVRIVWRRGGVVALAFETPAQTQALQPPAPAPQETNRDDLEAENRRLRQLLAEMEERLKKLQQGY